MSEFYQKADQDFIDYKMYELPGLKRKLRGPAFKEELRVGQYAASLGAAQTFGRFCEHPYPRLLSEELKFPVINLGVGGVGASNFMRPELIKFVNNGLFCIIQVMSGRSAPNCYFDSFSGQNVFGLDKENLGPAAFASQVIQYCIDNKSEQFVKNLVADMRWAWVRQMFLLAKKIKVPKVLVWFSTRLPDYSLEVKDLHLLNGGSYPQYIDLKTLLQALPYFDYFVECVSSRGKPHHLYHNGQLIKLDMGNGKGVSENKYYPTPEMHIDVQKALHSVCSSLITSDDKRLEQYKTINFLTTQSEASTDSIKPNFLIVGAAKSATSSIAMQIATHPMVFVPPKKELHFFDKISKDSKTREAQWQQYLAYFSGTQDFSCRGEATVAYTMCKGTDNHIPKLIYDYLGLIKIIYIVRHPFERLISQWRHAKRDQADMPEFQECILDPARRGLSVERSNYWLQIQPYRQVFGDDNIFIGFYEDYVQDFQSTLSQICYFLNVDVKDIPPLENMVLNKTSQKKVPKPEYSNEFRHQVMGQLQNDIKKFLSWSGKPIDYENYCD